MSTIAKALTNVNAGKVTSSVVNSASSSIKRIDFSTIAKKSSGAFSSSTPALTKISKMGGKSGKQLVSSINGFATHPGMRKQLGNVTSAMKKNPKIAAAGITATAAAGYVAFRMAEGATFEEALGEIADAAKGVVEDVSSSAGKAALGSADKILKNIFGENYLMYVKIAAVIYVLLMLRKFF